MAARRPLRTLLKWGTGTYVGTTLAGAAFIRVEYGEDALPRLIRTYSDAVPAFLDYKRVQWLYDKIPTMLGRDVDQQALHTLYDELDKAWSARMLQATYELGGFYMKA